MAKPTNAAVALLLLVILAVAGAAGQVQAGDRTATSRGIRGVLELFTSQGCASCPPADALLTQMAGETDIIALAYHVDYWDYIGWQDPLGSRRNAERQKAYVKRMKLGTLSTPQMIVNGDRALPGADAEGIRAVLQAEPLKGQHGGSEVRLITKGDTLHIFADATVDTNAGKPPVLMLITYVAETQTLVQRGENEGRHVVNTHAVRDWRVVGTVGPEPLKIDMPIALLTDPDGIRTGCVALLQTVGEGDKPGRILAATSLEF